ncbi:hypothetical protein Tco_0871967, partial [Tanacetum coccineum]
PSEDASRSLRLLDALIHPGPSLFSIIGSLIITVGLIGVSTRIANVAFRVSDLTADPPFSQNPKSSYDDGFKPSSDVEQKVNEDPRKESECNDQEKEDNVKNTNNVNTVSSTVNVAGTNKDNAELPVDPNMPALEDYSIFDLSSDDTSSQNHLKFVQEIWSMVHNGWPWVSTYVDKL